MLNHLHEQLAKKTQSLELLETEIRALRKSTPTQSCEIVTPKFLQEQLEAVTARLEKQLQGKTATPKEKEQWLKARNESDNNSDFLQPNPDGTVRNQTRKKFKFSEIWLPHKGIFIKDEK